MREKPTLTYLVSGLETGGAEVGMARLLSGLPPEAFDVTVVALYGGDRAVVPEIPSHVDVVDLDVDNKLALHKLAPLVPILRETDVLIGSVYHAEIVARLFGTAMGVETLLTWAHNTEFKSPLRRFVDRITIGCCDAVLADSEAVETMLVDRQGVDPDKIRTIPIAGLLMDTYDRPSVPLRSLDDAVVGGTSLDDVDEDAIVVGIIGSLVEAKNHDAVLDVADRLIDRDIHLAVAGDGPRRRELADAIHDRGLRNVSLLGHVDSVPAFLAAVDVYFQPSHYEGLCITVVEAMAAGKPVVASDAGEIPANVEHGTSGFVTTADDVDGFERYLQRLASNSDLRRRMGEAARERVRDTYSQATLVEQFRAAVEETHLSAGDA